MSPPTVADANEPNVTEPASSVARLSVLFWIALPAPMMSAPPVARVSPLKAFAPFRVNVPAPTVTATLRVPVAIPARSMKRNRGSRLTTTIEPGGDGLCLDIKG